MIAAILDLIRQIDARLSVAGERLARYRSGGQVDSIIVQRGVCDRLLDVRLELMAKRDAA